MNKLLKLSLVVFSGILSLNVNAVQMYGSLGYGTAVTPVNSSWVATSLASATGLDFDNADNADVDSVSGDFAAYVSIGDDVTMTDFQFNPLSPDPVSPLWSVGGFSFDLESVSIDFQSSTFLALSGTGVATGNGFDPTPGIWYLSVNPAGGTFNFSSGTTVPEPASLAIISLGLLGLGFASRRRKS